MKVPLLHDRLLGPDGNFMEPFDVILESVMMPDPDAEWFKSRFAKAQESVSKLRAIRESSAQEVAGRLIEFYSVESVAFQLPPGIESEWLTTPRVEATFLIGEFLGYIRNALDYLIFVLSWKNRGVPLSGTSFPLCVQEGSWKEHKGRIRGLTPRQREVVKAHQPFSGLLWTSYLSHYSNIDKHSSPVEALPRITARIQPGKQNVFDSNGRAYPYVEHVDVDYDFYIGHSTRSTEIVRGLPVLAEIEWGALHVYYSLTQDEGVKDALAARELQRRLTEVDKSSE